MDTDTQVDEEGQTIKPIHKDTVHKICSGQVVLSLAVSVKELVENSLDAGATIIDVRLKNYGIDMIEVSDNGSGVTEDNFAALTLKYHTSKLNEYSDLLGVTSFGFRGEALSSLSALANLIITTRHKSQEYATRIEYDYKGNISKTTPCSRQVGTTVTLSNLFYSLPVRQKELNKNVKREFNKMTQLLYAYCLISLGVKITCTNQTSNNAKYVVVATQGSTSYKDNIACVFGLKQLQNILEVKPKYVPNIKENIFRGLSGEVQEIEESSVIEDVEINLSEDSNDAENPNSQESGSPSTSSSQKSQGHKNGKCPIQFTGFISSCAHGSGRSSTDRQFFYVNSRPCEPTKITKVINEIYRQYNPNQYPFVFLNVNIDRTYVDVNVTPDKRKLFFSKEKIILDTLKTSLLTLFECIPRTLKVETSLNYNKDNNVTDDVKPDINQPRIFNSFLKQFANKNDTDSDDLQTDKNSKKLELKRKSTSMLDFVLAKVKKVQNEDSNEKLNEIISNQNDLNIQSSDCDERENNSFNSTLESNENDVSNDTLSIEGRKHAKEEINNISNDENSEVMYLENSDYLPATQIRNLSDIVTEKSHTTYCGNTNINKAIALKKKGIQMRKNVVTDKEDLGKNVRRSVVLKTSLEHVKALSSMCIKQREMSAPDRVKFRTGINPVFNKKCEEELSREISKESFKHMSVVGQFNLGFILTKLNDDLFIIDQHATDEIYNFETLQKTTELTSQKLVIPQQLELTGVNEQILMDNIEVFKKNGFTFEINEEELPTKRVKLLTIPMSKNWVFGKEDIEELLFMLRESPSECCRPSRVRAMFASRACRKSVMIGTALAEADMKKLVEHMAEIDKPWNCPHGRPTIRHLVNLSMVHTRDG